MDRPIWRLTFHGSMAVTRWVTGSGRANSGPCARGHSTVDLLSLPNRIEPAEPFPSDPGACLADRASRDQSRPERARLIPPSNPTSRDETGAMGFDLGVVDDVQPRALPLRFPGVYFQLWTTPRVIDQPGDRRHQSAHHLMETPFGDVIDLTNLQGSTTLIRVVRPRPWRLDRTGSRVRRPMTRAGDRIQEGDAQGAEQVRRQRRRSTVLARGDDVESVCRQVAAQGGAAEVVEVGRSHQVDPVLAPDERFPRAKVGDGEGQDTTWLEQASRLGESRRRNGQMLQDVPEGDDVEALGSKARLLERGENNVLAQAVAAPLTGVGIYSIPETSQPVRVAARRNWPSPHPASPRRIVLR